MDREEREPVLNRFDLEMLAIGVNFGIKITFCPVIEGAYVNTKIWYRKESNLWAQLDEKSVRRKEGFFKRIRQKSLRSAVRFSSAKGLFALILRDCVVTWPERKGRMDGYTFALGDKLGIKYCAPSPSGVMP
jgi:hypothetical protein